MRFTYISAVLLSLVCIALPAQNPHLATYISEGLESNLGLKQKQLDYAGDLSALKEAKGMFLPDLSM
ncbi:MAG: hypothetical protein KAH12_11735, partial [Anaerolineales bacterium]|nr:hypothetical protein [Anaerolineales bacterium]